MTADPQRRRPRALRRTGLLLAAVLVSSAAVAAPAQAATVIFGPTISTSTPVPTIGVPFDVTFTQDASPISAPAVAFEYQLDHGPTQHVDAPLGSVTVPITLTHHTTFIQAEAVAADGTVSGFTATTWLAAGAGIPAEKDLNGDGKPDLLTVGGTPGLASGLWFAPGRSTTGRVAVPAVSLGTEPFGAGSGTSYDGTEVVTGHFLGYNLTDVLVYSLTGQTAGNGALIPGEGDGSPLHPTDGGGTSLFGFLLADANGNVPLHLLNAYDAQHRSGGLDDLLGVVGDPVHGFTLAYYPNQGFPGGWFTLLTVTATTPDGDQHWDRWSLASTQLPSGTAMYLWNRSTGALYLWKDLTLTDNGDGTSTPSFTQYLVARHFLRRAAVATWETADFSGDGTPDLWVVTPTGVLRPFTVSRLSLRRPATVTARPTQQLG